MRNRLEEETYRILADLFSVDTETVRAIISSFFGSIITESRSLPFNDSRKIFTKQKFDEYVSVTNIPYIGRIGPSYTRYLKWRANASRDVEQKVADDFRSRLTEDEIEEAATKILSGESVELRKKKTTDLYKRVWLVGKTGKRQARQVIPKTKQDGI